MDRKDAKSNNLEIVLAKRDRNKDNHELEECKDKGRISDFNGSLRIGSPSFREYCTVDCNSEDGFKDDGGSDRKNKETKGKEGQGNASPKSNEESLNKSRQKKGKKKANLGKYSQRKGHLLSRISCMSQHATI